MFRFRNNKDLSGETTPKLLGRWILCLGLIVGACWDNGGDDDDDDDDDGISDADGISNGDGIDNDSFDPTNSTSTATGGDSMCIPEATEPCVNPVCNGTRYCLSNAIWSACLCDSPGNPGGADSTAGGDDDTGGIGPGDCFGDPGIGCMLEDHHCIEIEDAEFGGCLPHDVWDGAAPVGEPGTPGAPCGVGGYCDGGECLWYGDYDVCATFCQPALCTGVDEICIAASPCGGVCWLRPEDWPPLGVPGELWSPCFGGEICDEGTCVQPEDIFFWINIPVCMPLCT